MLPSYLRGDGRFRHMTYGRVLHTQRAPAGLIDPPTRAQPKGSPYENALHQRLGRTARHGRPPEPTMNSTIVGDQNIPMSSAVGPDTQLSERVHVHRRISWAAIFGAVILIISIQVLFSLLGAGIWLGTVNT